jgi:hypothetical protein
VKRSQLKKKKKKLNRRETEQEHLLGHLQEKKKIFIWLFNDGWEC